MIESLQTIAQRAGESILSFYGQPMPAEKKADDSPLTLADLAAHRVIVEGLRDLDSAIPVLSEESSETDILHRLSWETLWVVDPMDGTKEFIKQTGEFTVNIALVRSGVPHLGLVYVPAKKLLYWAEAEMGAFKQAEGGAVERIQTRKPHADALDIVASRDHAGPMVADLLHRFPTAQTRSMGSSLKFCLVAEGMADLYLRDVPTMEWDTAAAQCVVEQAGGCVQDLEGQTLSYNRENLRNPSLITMGDPSFDWRGDSMEKAATDSMVDPEA